MNIKDIRDQIVPRKRVSDTIYLVLKKAIIHGLISPQEKIDESLISKELDVSHGSIREAIRILEDDGYLIFNNRKGYLVGDVTLKNMIKLNEFLNILSFAAIKTINVYDTANIIILEESLKIKNKSTNYQEDKIFHKTLALCTYNNEIIKAMEDSYDRLLWGINVLSLNDFSDATLRNHQHIISRITNPSQTRDEELYEMMKTHFNLHLKDMIKYTIGADL